MNIRPLVVVILDGWGISFVEQGNAIYKAETPNMDSFAAYFPTAAIQAAGIEVGLPWGEVGNSETGHRNIGAGQVQYQALPQIDRSIEDKSFFKDEELLAAINHAKEHKSNLHLMGLVSPGGVHSHMNHLFALLEMCAKQNLHDRVYIHMFTDGRDTAPSVAASYVTLLEEAMGKHGVGTIASVTGRFYAMDRNQNWERTQATYDMLTGGPRISGAPNATGAIEQSYKQEVFDEMIPPTAITRGGGPIAEVKDNDAIIFFNFRPDRAIQLTNSFVQPDKVGFEAKQFSNLLFVTMTQYDKDIPTPAAFVEEKGEYPLARVLSEAGKKQFHLAETEKYAHVTYYLNVGHEEPFEGEEQVLIKSSGVESFADEPLMAAGEITDRLLEEIERGEYDVYFVNFANPDMVGHTGDFDATVEACAFVDECLGRIYQTTLGNGGGMLVTADHGNAEEVLHPATGEVEKDHTSNPVPLHFIAEELQRSTPRSEAELVSVLSSPIGVLADIAPTILEILEIKQPSVMTGVSLLNSLR